MVDWDHIVAHLSEGIHITTDPSRWNMSNPEYKNIYARWQESNFNMSSIKWTNYYPGTHFDISVINEVSEFLKLNVHRAWISKIDPGYFAPWHWDVDDNIELYLSKGDVIRYSIFIGKPHPAHFFTTDETVFSNTPQGTVYRWKDYKSWHAGANAGLAPKYMFHILGYQS